MGRMTPSWDRGILTVAAFLVLGILQAPPPLQAQETLSPEHERIDFLVGSWTTVSQFPDGQEGTGELEYRWVFDGAWMKVEFQGVPPQGGGGWEAHVMQRWNPEKEGYEAWVFQAQGPPLLYRGSSPEPGLFRVEYEGDDGVVTGIDYHDMEDGTVYQENWILEPEAEERRITLRTSYEPNSPGDGGAGSHP